MAQFLDYTGLQTLVNLLKSYADTAASDAVSSFDHTIFKVVSALPDVADADSDKIYIVPDAASTENQNVYDEYYLADGAWEKLGSFKADVDLTGYIKDVKIEGSYATATTTDGVVTITLSIPEATTSAAGLLSASDKTKLDSINTDTVVNEDDLSDYAKTEDLDAYIKSEDFTAITDDEINALFE